MYVYMYVCMYMHMCIHMYKNMCIYMYVCVSNQSHVKLNLVLRQGQIMTEEVVSAGRHMGEGGGWALGK